MPSPDYLYDVSETTHGTIPTILHRVYSVGREYSDAAYASAYAGAKSFAVKYGETIDFAFATKLFALRRFRQIKELPELHFAHI